MEQMECKRRLNANTIVNRKHVKKSCEGTQKINVHLLKSDVFESLSQQGSNLMSPCNLVLVST